MDAKKIEKIDYKKKDPIVLYRINSVFEWYFLNHMYDSIT